MPGRIILNARSDGTVYTAPGGNPIWTSDFEENDWSEWSSGPHGTSGGDLSIVTSPVLYGTYAMRVLVDDQNQGYYIKTIGPYTDEFWLHFYIRWDDVEDDTWTEWTGINPYLVWDGSYNVTAGIVFEVDNATPNKFALLDAQYRDNTPSLQQVQTSFVPVVNTLYEVKGRWKKVGAGSDIIQVWIGTPGDLSLVINSSTLTFSSAWSVDEIAGGKIMVGPGGTTFNYYCDNFSYATGDEWP